MLSDTARQAVAAYKAIADLQDKADAGTVASDDIEGFPTDQTAVAALANLGYAPAGFLREMAKTSEANRRLRPAPVAKPAQKVDKAPAKPAAKKTTKKATKKAKD